MHQRFQSNTETAAMTQETLDDGISRVRLCEPDRNRLKEQPRPALHPVTGKATVTQTVSDKMSLCPSVWMLCSLFFMIRGTCRKWQKWYTLVSVARKSPRHSTVNISFEWNYIHNFFTCSTCQSRVWALSRLALPGSVTGVTSFRGGSRTEMLTGCSLDCFHGCMARNWTGRLVQPIVHGSENLWISVLTERENRISVRGQKCVKHGCEVKNTHGDK